MKKFDFVRLATLVDECTIEIRPGETFRCSTEEYDRFIIVSFAFEEDIDSSLFSFEVYAMSEKTTVNQLLIDIFSCCFCSSRCFQIEINELIFFLDSSLPKRYARKKIDIKKKRVDSSIFFILSDR